MFGAKNQTRNGSNKNDYIKRKMTEEIVFFSKIEPTREEMKHRDIFGICSTRAIISIVLQWEYIVMFRKRIQDLA